MLKERSATHSVKWSPSGIQHCNYINIINSWHPLLCVCDVTVRFSSHGSVIDYSYDGRPICKDEHEIYSLNW